MEVWPAIDIRGGRCVRLCQGDFNRETVYAEDPVEMAHHWQRLGARRLHIVDLDGARTGNPINFPIIIKIIQATGLVCQVGGGLRQMETVAELLKTGVARVVIGTRAIKDPQWFRELCRKFPGHIVLGLDARDGLVATDGWLETTREPAIDVARRFEGEPLAAIVYTDIASDGMLKGVNVAAMAEMQRSVTVPVIASGGIATLEDIRALKAAGLAGCILGRALYEQRFSLREALEVAGDHGATQESSASANSEQGG
ncbi:1-(5-phosphoribosyl)-5-[(5-phosphoribosylamino)methylideneamino]imidazole-4-carboxamide isomerase [Thermogutta sp.]|uniref:1-(5-phosphoribosyl)-5-[(5- phosphoribosylamino)methylideneamino]imidazole-4- carboxamide isomerase n=1 Tax=Thermogutta sp. TaxID=1962930 RepID=UPI0032207C45